RQAWPRCARQCALGLREPHLSGGVEPPSSHDCRAIRPTRANAAGVAPRPRRAADLLAPVPRHPRRLVPARWPRPRRRAPQPRLGRPILEMLGRNPRRRAAAHPSPKRRRPPPPRHSPPAPQPPHPPPLLSRRSPRPAPRSAGRPGPRRRDLAFRPRRTPPPRRLGPTRPPVAAPRKRRRRARRLPLPPPRRPRARPRPPTPPRPRPPLVRHRSRLQPLPSRQFPPPPEAPRGPRRAAPRNPPPPRPSPARPQRLLRPRTARLERRRRHRHLESPPAGALLPPARLSSRRPRRAPPVLPLPRPGAGRLRVLRLRPPLPPPQLAQDRLQRSLPHRLARHRAALAPPARIHRPLLQLRVPRRRRLLEGRLDPRPHRTPPSAHLQSHPRRPRLARPLPRLRRLGRPVATPSPTAVNPAGWLAPSSARVARAPGSHPPSRPCAASPPIPKSSDTSSSSD